MSNGMIEKNTQKMNGTIDIVKLLMAILVIGIHTEPFSFNFWLDKGFGICTRLCVPFFFVTSAYFYWRKEKSAKSFLSRIVLLYVIWSVIYLPFDIPVLREMSIPQLLHRFLWAGNEHGLWYLCGTIIGFIVPSRWRDGQPYISLLPLLHKKVAVFVFLLYCLSTPTYTIKNKSRCLCLVYHVFGFPTIHFCFHDLLQGKLSLVDRLFSLFRRFLWIS